MNDWQAHIVFFLSGSTALGIVAHALTTFPTPKNPYGQWLLGVCKYIVGQRVSAVNALQGLQTATVGITNDQKAMLANGSTLRIVETSQDLANPAGEATGKFKSPTDTGTH